MIGLFEVGSRYSPVSSFMMPNVTEYQVHCLFNALDNNKTSISIPNTQNSIFHPFCSYIFTKIYNIEINTGIVPKY